MLSISVRPERLSYEYIKTEKEKTIKEQPTHKTAHLQTAQANARPKFAKELFSCRRTHR